MKVLWQTKRLLLGWLFYIFIYIPLSLTSLLLFSTINFSSITHCNYLVFSTINNYPFVKTKNYCTYTIHWMMCAFCIPFLLRLTVWLIQYKLGLHDCQGIPVKIPHGSVTTLIQLYKNDTMLLSVNHNNASSKWWVPLMKLQFNTSRGYWYRPEQSCVSSIIILFAR